MPRLPLEEVIVRPALLLALAVASVLASNGSAGGRGQAPARVPAAENHRYPADSGVVDVTRPPYSAPSDGVTDATDALQRALNELAGTRRALYFPQGTYLVARTLKVPLRNPQGNHLYGHTHFLGQGRSRSVIRLKDGAFPNPASPAAMVDHGPHGSADWFANTFQDLTLDTGRDNPGAIGLRFFSNNTGAVRRVTIRSGDGKGVCGLDLAYNDMNGPLLVDDVEVEGFRVGVRCGASVNSQTFRNLRLRDQGECGLLNEGQCVSIEGLNSAGSVPVVRNRAGQMVLLSANLPGTGDARGLPAIENGADLFASDVKTLGFLRAIGGMGSARSHAGATVKEFASFQTPPLFPAGQRVALPSASLPATPWDDPATWKSPFQFGAERKEGADITDGLQRAIDSGATTVYIPTGAWRISRTVHLRGKLRRLTGMFSYLIPEEPVNSQNAPYFHFDSTLSGPVTLDSVSSGFGWKKVYGVQNDSPHPVILRDCELYEYRNRLGAGPLFIENVVAQPFTFTRQKVHAWQLNQETEGTHITNDGGSVRIVGLKTERGGTLVHTSSGGRTEILGGLCYTTTAGKLAPMFTAVDSEMTLSIGERCYSGDPYRTIIRETRKGVTREMAHSDAAYGGRLVHYVGVRPKPKGGER